MKSENAKTYREFNRLLKTIKIKQKQFEQEHYEEFLFDQTRKLKKGEPIHPPKCKEIINRSSGSKIKDKFEDLIDEINESTIIPGHAKPIISLKSKSKRKTVIYPKSHIFTMKIIGK